MIINETHIRKIVAEALNGLLLELSLGEIGRLGPIQPSDMIDPTTEFAEEYKISKAAYEEQKRTGKKINIEKVFGNTEPYRAWKNYYTAMMSKEGKKASGFMNWLHFLCNGKKGQKMYGYKTGGSYLFGMWIDGYFLCSYFAPEGKMGMWHLISGLSQYNNVIFAVTQDMSPMLERLGMPKAGTTHDAPYQGKIVTKDVFGTSQEAIQKGFEFLDQGIAMDNMKKSMKDLAKKDDEIGKAAKEIMSRYDGASAEQKAEINAKVSEILKTNPELLKKIAKNGFRI